MKVLRITTELNYGGIEKVFELHAKYHDRSFDLVFIALGKGGSTHKLLQQLGYRVIILASDKVAIPSLSLIHILKKVFREEKPDVVHAAGAEANFHVTIAAKLTGIKKVICEEIGIPNHSQKAKLIFRLLYHFSDRVIAISKAVEDYLVTSKEVPAKKIKLIYNPVDEARGLNGQGRNEQLLTVVARLEPVKNLSFLLDVFAEILKSRPEVKLIIVGDGSQKNLLQEQINKLGIPDNVTLLGFLPDPYPVLSESTYFILPSLFEGFGLACIEAIQAGNVAICSNSGGIPEFINDSEQGFLFDPRSRSSMLSALNKAFSLSREERESVVVSAQQRICQLFSPTKYIKQLNSLYFE